MSARPSLFSLLAWAALVAALAAAAGPALAVACALLVGAGGLCFTPLTELVLASPASRARDAHRARAPDTQGRRRAA